MPARCSGVTGRCVSSKVSGYYVCRLCPNLGGLRSGRFRALRWRKRPFVQRTPAGSYAPHYRSFGQHFTLLKAAGKITLPHRLFGGGPSLLSVCNEFVPCSELRHMAIEVRHHI